MSGCGHVPRPRVCGGCALTLAGSIEVLDARAHLLGVLISRMEQRWILELLGVTPRALDTMENATIELKDGLYLIEGTPGDVYDVTITEMPR